MLRSLQHPEMRQTSLSLTWTAECQIFKGNSGTCIQALFPDMSSYQYVIFKHSTWTSFENFAQCSREKGKGAKEEWRLRGRCFQGRVKGIHFFILGVCQKPCEADSTPAEVCERSLARWAARKDLKPGMRWWFLGWGREQNQRPQAMSGLSSQRTQSTVWHRQRAKEASKGSVAPQKWARDSLLQDKSRRQLKRTGSLSKNVN